MTGFGPIRASAVLKTTSSGLFFFAIRWLPLDLGAKMRRREFIAFEALSIGTG